MMAWLSMSEEGHSVGTSELNWIWGFFLSVMEAHRGSIGRVPGMKPVTSHHGEGEGSGGRGEGEGGGSEGRGREEEGDGVREGRGRGRGRGWRE